MRARHAVSERRVCRVLGFERTVLRYMPTRRLTDAPLRAKERELAAAYRRRGVPRLHWRLQREGLRVNYKRVERLYHPEGLAVRRRERKRMAVPRVSKAPVLTSIDEWGMDFVSDTLALGWRFRCVTVIDVCTHECMALVAAHGLPGVAVIEALEHVIDQRGAPVHRSLYHGYEFRSRAFDAWAADTHIELRFIQPVKPIQNAHIESFNGRLRDESLNSDWFLTLLDARLHLKRFRQSYNTDRPSRASWSLTPAEHADTFAPSPARRSA